MEFIGEPTGQLVLYKRWRLRAGTTPEQVATLVAERVAPHYRSLSPEVVLGLEMPSRDTFLAIQRWSSRSARDEAMTGAASDLWWQDYLPILARWETLVEFDAEWECDVLI